MKRITAVVYGVGAMGCLAARLMLEKGVDIVGAIARSPAKVGRDLGDIAGLGRHLGVPVEADAEAVLARRADIVLLSTQSFLPEIHEQLRACIRHGSNVVTISEESLYPWHSSPVLAAEIDALARAHCVTVVGSGHQDVFWVNLVTTLAGAAHRLEAIAGRASWNADDYGADVIKQKHVGTTLAEFEAWASAASRPPTYGRCVLGAIAASLCLTPTRWETEVRPVIADVPVRSNSIGKTFPAGSVIGYSDIETLFTQEGPRLVFEMGGYVYKPGETDINEWTLSGEPNLFMSNGQVDTRTSTCTNFVNRIPDVILAPPGFVTVDRLPAPRYRALPMHAYMAREQIGADRQAHPACAR